MISLTRASVPRSTPFTRESTGTAGSGAPKEARVARSCWAGTATATASVPSSACAGSEVAVTAAGSSCSPV